MPGSSGVEESEFVFKKTLSPESVHFTKCTSAMSSHSSQFPVNALPPVNLTPTFGVIGALGVTVSIIAFALDIVSDVILAYALWNQAATEKGYYRQKEAEKKFAITLAIIVVPLVMTNIMSLVWYIKSKCVMWDTPLFYKKTKCDQVVCVLLHILLLGPLIRYFDVLHYGRKMQRYFVDLDLGDRGSVQRLTPKGEMSASLQQELSKSTALLDLLRCFFQDAPQMVFQMVLVYRYPHLQMESYHQFAITAQILKLIIGLFAICWALLSYQDEVRRSMPGKMQLTSSSAGVCLLWRVGTLGTRFIAIGSFASLKVDGEGGLIKVYSDNAPMGLVLSFPAICALILAGHWIIMIVWIYAEKTNFFTKRNGDRRPCLEFLYDIAMSWVHVFAYVNMRDAPSRRRMIFFYAIVFVENTAFIVVWYLQVITKELWLRVIVVFVTESLFVVGICSAIGYYSFLHPDRNNLRQINASWRR